MANTMVDEILQQLSRGGMAQIARQTGLPPAEASRAVEGALPAILAGLAGNATKSPGEAESLASALDRNHDGSVLDDLAGFLGGGGAATDGGDILGHVFGPRRPKVESNLGRASGIDPATMAKVMALLAPIVMAMLGRAKRSQGLDSDGVASTLGKEKSRLEQRSPSGMDALGRMLDADGDGSFLDDLAGSLFKKR